jgi:hypothetical protein
MTPQQLQEEISKAYLHAVAAKCGFSVASWSQDHGCVDTTVGAASPVGGGYLYRPKVDVQLKATTRAGVEHDDFVSWTLDIEHYDSLRARAHTPHLLVVLLLPDDISESVEHTIDHLLIRRCAYWVNMTGMKAAPGKAKSKTIRLPKINLFSPEALQGILTRISGGISP